MKNSTMTQEHKELLLKDLCARLSYGVKCNVGDNKPYTLSRIEIDDNNGHLLDFIEMKDGLDMQVYLSEVKPYLFPLSSMTAEQIRKFYRIKGLNLSEEELIQFNSNNLSVVSNITTYNWSVDFLNKNHFDYRGLIDKGLAIDATNLNIY